MSRKLMNLREEFGRKPFPVETPRTLQLKMSVMQSLGLAASPVPMPPVLGDTVLYLDLSKWNYPMDFSVAWDRGIRIVFIKVSQGMWVDARFEQLVQAALDAGMLVGFYHFIDPTQDCTPEEAAAQAANLTHGVGALSMWMDAEWNGDLLPAQMLDYLIRFHDTYKSIDNRMVEIYTRHSFFTTKVLKSDFWERNDVGLNTARYHLGLTSPWSDNRYVPRDWKVTIPDFLRKHWQYSADGNGLGAYFGSSGAISMDLNLFRGNWNDILTYYGVDEAVPPIPPIQPEECLWKFENIKRVRYRTEPIISRWTEYSYKDPGDIITAKNVVVPNGYEVWLEFDEGDQTFYSALVYRGNKFYEPIR